MIVVLLSRLPDHLAIHPPALRTPPTTPPAKPEINPLIAPVAVASSLVFGLTYTGTLVVALVMFLGQAAAFTALLALVGTIRLLVIWIRAGFKRSGWLRQGPAGDRSVLCLKTSG